MGEVTTSKAFHAVAGGPDTVKRILDLGELQPARERINPVAADEMCQGWLAEASKKDSKAIPLAVHAFEELIEERLSSIISVAPYAQATHFDCEDILAGDLNNVFLSIDGWHDALSEEEVARVSGFVFDSRQLIEAGGMFRGTDLIDSYWQVLSDFLYKPVGVKTVRALKRRFGDMQRKHVLTGRRAISALSKDHEGMAEILFPDRLPLEWAIEIWEEGRRIT